MEPDGTVTVGAKAPPVKGQANREIVKWLPKTLKKTSSQIRIVAGIHSNIKIVEIVGMNKQRFLTAIKEKQTGELSGV